MKRRVTVNLRDLSKRADLYPVGKDGILATVEHRNGKNEFVIIYILKHVVNSEFELRRAFGINKKYINFVFDANVEKQVKLSLK